MRPPLVGRNRVFLPQWMRQSAFARSWSGLRSALLFVTHLAREVHEIPRRALAF
jgi:hypothetical protein